MDVDAAALKQARIDARLSLAQVAGDSMTRQAVHLFETGRARPTLAKLRLIVERLGNITMEAALVSATEHRLAELDLRQRHDELGALARRLLRVRGLSRRTRAIAGFYTGRAILNREPARAVTVFRRAGQQLTRVSEWALAAEAMDWEAAARYLLQDVTALDVGLAALELYRGLEGRDPQVEARMLEHIATYRLRRGEHVDAIENYRAAVEVAGARLDLARLANVYHGLAEGWRQAGDAQQALEYMERAVHLLRTQQDANGLVSANLARAENDYGVHLMHAGRYDRAEEMIRASLSHSAVTGVESGRAHALLSMGELCRRRNRPGEAVEWTLCAIDLARKLGESITLAAGHRQLGELLAAGGAVEPGARRPAM